MATVSDEATRIDLDTEIRKFLTGEDYRVDPYPLFERLRATDPVYWSETNQMWIATDFEPCHQVLHGPEFSSQHSTASGYKGSPKPGSAKEILESIVLFRDRPEHTRLRSLLTKAFSGRDAELKRAAIAAQIDDQLRQVADRGSMDYLNDFARPSPMLMMCALIGLPYERHDDITRWSNSFAALQAPVVGPEEERIADEAFADYREFLAPLIAERQAEPRDDVLSVLVEGERAGGLSRDELVAYCLLLIVAGHLTTTYQMANALYLLLQHRDQWELLLRRPELARQAVEETLRFEASSRFVPRWASADVELGGHQIKKGQTVYAMLMIANRDPAVFPDPTRFDIERTANRQLTFGNGIHMCLGASLARVELQESLLAVGRLFPDIELAGPVDWEPIVLIRALTQLPVRWSATA